MALQLSKYQRGPHCANLMNLGLVAGLVSLVWLSAGLIVVLAVHHHWSQPQPQMRLSETTPEAVDYQEAA
jgi:hypothetical protein